MNSTAKKYLDEWLDFAADDELQQSIKESTEAIKEREVNDTANLLRLAKKKGVPKEKKIVILLPIEPLPTVTIKITHSISPVKVIGKVELPPKRVKVKKVPAPKVGKAKKPTATKRKYTGAAHRWFIYNRDKWMCLKCFCADRKRLTIDHIIPLVKGGKNELPNYQTLCVKCNGDKKDTIIDYRTDTNTDFDKEEYNRRTIISHP